MRPLRISAISFLNTAPLMWDFEHQPSAEIAENFTIEYTVPSSCAQALREGSADIGIIPVITTATIPDLVAIPGVAIAALGPVASISLISKVPIEQIHSVAMDTSSRTSVGLTTVLLNKFFSGLRESVPMAPQLDPMLERCEAALLIGDSALTADTKGYYVYDLAEVWREKTGLPFVFAVWAVRRQALAEMKPGLPLAQIFQRSRDHGLEPDNMATLCRDWTAKINMSEPHIQHYLRHNIHYFLDDECRRGLSLYFRYAAECGVIPRATDLEFL